MMKMKTFGVFIFATLVMAIIIGLSTGGIKVNIANSEEPKTEYDLFYMYGGPKGTYWLEPTAEYENIVFVENEALEEWGIVPTQLGEKYTGTFDETGWDLIKIEKKEGKDQ